MVAETVHVENYMIRKLYDMKCNNEIFTSRITRIRVWKRSSRRIYHYDDDALKAIGSVVHATSASNNSKNLALKVASVKRAETDV